MPRRAPGHNMPGMGNIRHVLVANELASYRECIAAVLRYSFPDLEVFEAASPDLNRAVLRLRPELVICSQATSLVRDRVRTGGGRAARRGPARAPRARDRRQAHRPGKGPGAQRGGAPPRVSDLLHVLPRRRAFLEGAGRALRPDLHGGPVRRPHRLSPRAGPLPENHPFERCAASAAVRSLTPGAFEETRGGGGVPPAQTERENTAGEPGVASSGVPDRGSPAARYGLAGAAVAPAAGGGGRAGRAR